MTDVSPASAPKVSVVSITYNHEAFIRDTLDGFVAQKTDFPVEIVIADDASTDATAAIIQDYMDRYPHLFRAILRPTNVGIHANLTDALSAARGEYLAICEGDDYWTDPMKLSKQVAFLDQHPETSLCFHPVQVLWTDGRKGSEFPPTSWRRDLSVDALIRRNFMQTNSVLYRRQARYDDIPPDVMPMDWYLHVRHAAQGGIAMLPETMAVYRRHPQSFWYGADVDRAKFWVSHGRGHAAMFEAMLDLFPDDPTREELIADRAYWILREIGRIPGPEGRAALLDTIAHHPRSAMLALQHRWKPPARHFTALLRRLWRARRIGKRTS